MFSVVATNDHNVLTDTLLLADFFYKYSFIVGKFSEDYWNRVID